MNSEIIKLPYGYTAEIEQDECPCNPFTDWDGGPPMLVYYDRHFTEYAGGVSVADLVECIPLEVWKSREGKREIIEAVGATVPDVARMIRDYGFRDAIREIAYDCKPSAYGSLNEHFDRLEAVATLARVPHYRGTSTGHAQRHWAEVFVAAMPKWAERVGAPVESLPGQCKAAFELYGAWAWGDVYGVATIRRPNGDEMTDGSCWGFYGADHKESGLMDHCLAMVNWDRAERRKRADGKRAALRAERAAAMDAACRDIATVN